MSGFVHPGATGLPLHMRDLRNHCDSEFHGSHTIAQQPMLLNTQLAHETNAHGWTTPWWPAHGNMFGGFDGVSENVLGPTAWYAAPWVTTGCNGRLGFVGYTRDAYGSVLGGCTVKCFRTSTDELVSSVQSDANGFYIATTPYNDGHYLVVQKASATPPVAGASINTITPA